MHRYQRLVHPSKQFGTGFVKWPSELLLYYSWCHQCHQNAFLSIFPLSSVTEKSHWGLDPVYRQGVSNTVVCLVAKNSLTDSAMWAGADARSMSCWQKYGSFPSNFFTQSFQYFQIVYLVECSSSWYKFVTKNPCNIKVRELYCNSTHMCMYTHIHKRTADVVQLFNCHALFIKFYM